MVRCKSGNVLFMLYKWVNGYDVVLIFDIVIGDWF